MGNVILEEGKIPEELAQVLAEIDADGSKSTCDSPGCETLRSRKQVIRIVRHKAVSVDLFFCCEEHMQQAAIQWGF